MIEIKMPYITNSEGKSKVHADIVFDGVVHNVWFEVEEKYEKFLLYERADAFLIGILSLAMRRKENIVSEAPISEELLYNIETDLIPILSKYSKKLGLISIKAPVAKEQLVNEGKVGTGVSGGIDSFHAIATHVNCQMSDYNLTHLLIHNTGSFNNIYAYAGIDNVRNACYERAQKIANELNLELIATDSNILDELKQNHLWTNTYTNTFAIYCLSKLFHKYYLGSCGLDYKHFSIENSEYADSAHYDLLSLNCFSTSNLRIYSDGGAKSRVEKTKVVADFPTAQKYLHVCVANAYNCGMCPKCKRTLLHLDLLGKLEDFKEVFNIEEYKKNKRDILEWLVQQHLAGESANEYLYSEDTYRAFKGREEERKIIEEIERGYNVQDLMKENTKIKRELGKWKDYTRYFRKMLGTTDITKQIEKKLLDKNLQHIAFYGDSIITQEFTKCLENSNIIIDYIVENTKVKRRVPIIRRDSQQYPKVDAIIVADLIHLEVIRKKLVNMVDFPILTVYDIFEK